MKTVKIEVSEAFAKNLQMLRDLFDPKMSLAQAADHFGGWVFSNLLTDTDMFNELGTEVNSARFASEEEVEAFGDRLQKFCGKDILRTFGWEWDEGKEGWALIVCTDEIDEAVLDFCIRERYRFANIRELYRLQVACLDKEAGLPGRNWVENPPTNHGEILALIKAGLESRSQEAREPVAA